MSWGGKIARAEKAPPGQGEAGPDEGDAAEGRDDGEGLAGQAARFTGVDGADPGVKLMALVLAGVGLPADDFTGVPIEGELGRGVGPPAVAQVDEEGGGSVGGARKAEADGTPAGGPVFPPAPRAS